MIKNIIFDLGGVLIDWNPKNVFRTIFSREEDVDLFLSNICTMDWNVQQDAGRSLEDATSFLQNKCPEWHNEIAAYYGRWEEMLTGPIPETVEVLKELVEDPKLKVVALTNWSAETFPIALERYDFLHWFEGIVVSGTEKCIKPDRKIYDIILERYNLVPEESIFIDDNMYNVEAAQKIGIIGHHFSSPTDLKSYLNKTIVE
jgi:2-haloacid dehalogenase